MASDLNPQQNAKRDAQARQYNDNECVAAAALLQLWQANQDVQKTEPFNHEYAASDQDTITDDDQPYSRLTSLQLPPRRNHHIISPPLTPHQPSPYIRPASQHIKAAPPQQIFYIKIESSDLPPQQTLPITNPQPADSTRAAPQAPTTLPSHQPHPPITNPHTRSLIIHHLLVALDPPPAYPTTPPIDTADLFQQISRCLAHHHQLDYSAKAIEEYWNELGREECGIDEREFLLLRRQEAERADDMEVDDVEGEVDNATVAESAKMCDE